MNWKQFLKPDWRKIIIVLIFLIAPTHREVIFGSDVYLLGVPLPCLSVSWSFVGNRIDGLHTIPIFLLIDIAIGYLIGCFIIWIYDKVKKK